MTSKPLSVKKREFTSWETLPKELKLIRALAKKLVHGRKLPPTQAEKIAMLDSWRGIFELDLCMEQLNKETEEKLKVIE